MTYYDFEQDTYLSTEELMASFNELKAARETEAETFDEYLQNCMDYNNGTLEINERTVVMDVLSRKGRKMVGYNGNRVERVNKCLGKYAMYEPDSRVGRLTNNIEAVFEWLEV